MDPASAPPRVLVFAGLDPSGGAGLQADIEAVASMGCRAAPVATAVTVQDTRDVLALEPLPPKLVAAQARAVLDDLPVAAIKIGLLGSAAIAAVVREILLERPGLPVVLDPIVAAGGGRLLADDAQVEALRDLLAHVTLVTPNGIEVRHLARSEADDPTDCALILQQLGAPWVLVTGGHDPGDEVVNRLFGPDGAREIRRWPRLDATYHGSGCTLASACAGLLAGGRDVASAVASAQRYTWEALRHGSGPGRGQHLPDRLFWTDPYERPEGGS